MLENLPDEKKKLLARKLAALIKARAGRKSKTSGVRAGTGTGATPHQTVYPPRYGESNSQSQGVDIRGSLPGCDAKQP